MEKTSVSVESITEDAVIDIEIFQEAFTDWIEDYFSDLSITPPQNVIDEWSRLKSRLWVMKSAFDNAANRLRTIYTLPPDYYAGCIDTLENSIEKVRALDRSIQSTTNSNE